MPDPLTLLERLRSARAWYLESADTFEVAGMADDATANREAADRMQARIEEEERAGKVAS